ncbi:beta strand repeat-containing protein [Bdellovibrio sp. HCB185ZH]|uniref:beta strand repeat-containing protein n=1 Tax=Bdellovibrio sp. HCB185ZH TaxID=3394235 RepID=UPI0039A451E9
MVYASPQKLTYQGRIVDSTGHPLTNNDVTFRFQITSMDGLCVLYYEERQHINMQNSDGIFDIAIGDGSVIYAVGGSNKLSDTFINGVTHNCYGSGTWFASASSERLLKVSFHDGTGWQAIDPANTIRSVPFAMSSYSAQTLADKTLNDLILKASLTSCTAGQALSWNGTTFSCVATSSGTLTGVTAGTGLTGGGTTGNVTLSLAASGVTAGTYGSATQVPVIAVDATGRITSVTATAVSGGGSSGLTSLNGETGSSQTFATPGTSGTAPSWSSTSNSHTLNIPLASSAGVTAGLLSKADYDAFAGKQASGSYVTALTGDVTATGPGSAAATIANSAVTTGKIASATILGSNLNFTGVNAATTNMVLKDSTGKFFDFACGTAGHVATWSVAGWSCQAISVSASSFGSQAQNTFLAAPSGSSGNATFRTIASADLPITGATGVFTNGGNSFGTAASLGTNDARNLTFKTNGTTRMTLASSGTVEVNADELGFRSTSGNTSQLTFYRGAKSTSFGPDSTTLDLWSDENIPFNITLDGANQIMTVLPTGKVGIGTTSPSANFQVNSALTGTSGQLYTNFFYATAEPTAASTATYYGSQGTVANYGSNTRLNGATLTGMAGLVEQGGTGVIGNANAVEALVSKFAAGNMTYVNGFYSHLNSSTSGTVDTFRGLYVSTSISGTSSLTNGYGVYIDPMNGSTSSYGIYQSGANDTNYFAGRVGINNTAPNANAKLEVTGTIVSTPNTIANASVNLATSNTTVLTTVGGSAITLSNMVHGGNYTLVIQDTTSRTYTFGGCNTSKFIPPNAATVSGTWSTYNILTIKNGANFDCLITWATGYQ